MKADLPRAMARIVSLLVLAVFLAACGKSTVVRSPSAGGAVSVSKPRPGESVLVKRGDTLYSLARAQGMTVADMARWNGLRPPYTIYPGQRLRLGPAAGTAKTAPPKAGTAPGTSAPRAPAPPKAPANSGFAWRWPAQGVLLGTYEAGNTTRQGIDIGGSSGEPVIAAADGVVVYSGAGLIGYGELIIVKHNEQWLSAYGHNRTRLVGEGQSVKAGQQIAEMGRTGAARDMLHFEIRHNGKPVDPLLYLPKR